MGRSGRDRLWRAGHKAAPSIDILHCKPISGRYSFSFSLPPFFFSPSLVLPFRSFYCYYFFFLISTEWNERAVLMNSLMMGLRRLHFIFIYPFSSLPFFPPTAISLSLSLRCLSVDSFSLCGLRLDVVLSYQVCLFLSLLCVFGFARHISLLLSPSL